MCHMAIEWTSEHEMFRRTVRDFVASEVAPHTVAWEAAGSFPAHELFKRMGELGFLGVEYDPAYGGQGADHTYTAILAEELGPGGHHVRGHGHRRADRHGHPVAARLRHARAQEALPRARPCGARWWRRSP